MFYGWQEIAELQVTVGKRKAELWPQKELGLDFKKAFKTIIQAFGAHGDLTNLALHERLPEILIVPRKETHTAAAFLPGESQGRGSLVGCRLWGRTESDMTEVT